MEYSLVSDEERRDYPGGVGEHDLQERFDTKERALRFYENSMHHSLNEVMKEFIEERIMFFLSTADADGKTDCSPRIGPQGFVTVIDDEHLCYPEYRGNGIHASLGNMTENRHASMLFVDWWETTVGLHVNGRTTLRESHSEARDLIDADKQKIWVELEVEEAYIHCAKHIPRLDIEEFDPPWGTDDSGVKKSGFFSE